MFGTFENGFGGEESPGRYMNYLDDADAGASENGIDVDGGIAGEGDQ